ncbi:hypothetical protein L905_04585 [Agrobacterium sp. TS43]|nr:hypothetical protein K538_03815 [Agrobacterium tumefaciens GW4]KVK42630.1 hypothetical protein L904_10865 [Agrobacterium sp. LY4]KVK42963.1 hypothetical protein L903_10885 [Agrobacterium sp. JL28]KVK57210.1 hypothetical protein L906_10850 [Agrobacterium sp. TS45]KVK59988.1 hypothetical protein L907_10830 [Agrobacterium sp. C13]KVK67355.1 hypothetical protein L905_04585 [Agrobacterium sp. TS43]
MELFQAGHKIKNIGLSRVATGMIFFGGFDDQVDNGGETAATATAFFHGVIHFCRNDELPTVLVEELVDDVPDIVIGDVIAAANQHDGLPV